MAEQKKDVQFGPRMSERKKHRMKSRLAAAAAVRLWWLHWLLPVSSIPNL